MQKKISLLWSKHLKDQEAKENFNKSVHGSKQVLDRLKNVIDEWIQALESEQLDFTTPSWAYKQAALISEKRTLEKIKRFITIE